MFGNEYKRCNGTEQAVINCPTDKVDMGDNGGWSGRGSST